MSQAKTVAIVQAQKPNIARKSVKVVSEAA